MKFGQEKSKKVKSSIPVESTVISKHGTGTFFDFLVYLWMKDHNQRLRHHKFCVRRTIKSYRTGSICIICIIYDTDLFIFHKVVAWHKNQNS